MVSQVNTKLSRTWEFNQRNLCVAWRSFHLNNERFPHTLFIALHSCANIDFPHSKLHHQIPIFWGCRGGTRKANSKIFPSRVFPTFPSAFSKSVFAEQTCWFYHFLPHHTHIAFSLANIASWWRFEMMMMGESDNVIPILKKRNVTSYLELTLPRLPHNLSLSDAPLLFQYLIMVLETSRSLLQKVLRLAVLWRFRTCPAATVIGSTHLGLFGDPIRIQKAIIFRIMPQFAHLQQRRPCQSMTTPEIGKFNFQAGNYIKLIWVINWIY